ncbi:MAG TPA: phosphoglycerate kinase [Bacteroidales bacterium]|jgi:phosphoglycerate kinase|nr:phosphoglycerate kinase [Bacteroidales bacterium]OQB59970.1 MAG: Phosphoglycerate kinase [Bacteroidetes bacterium ADurb.Bin145]HOU02096.1 phosphoglycerate kinase [Bacteroidales bacterium]HQG62198.1 phosphoglycerate kinase [Bacteroidales bacterium]HQK68116.1 phosphoglycerate kinase [Bacteroidales bacterium]
MKMIQDFNFKGIKTIVRVDFNVPLDKKTFVVTDDTRIRGALPTIKKIIADGGSVILMSHLGRPEGRMEKYSLKPVLPVLEKHLGKKVLFADDCLGESAVKMSAALKPGEVLLLENVRFYPEEEGKPILPETATDEEKKAAKAELKAKQKELAKKLASYADVYVNDAFGTAHRAHGTTAVIADYFPADKRMFGFLINSELAAMDRVLNNAQHPFTAIMGGAKVSDKIMLIENLLNRVDNLIIGGGMTYTFIKAKGGKIGKSLCEEDKLDLALKIIEKAKEKGVNLYLPVDSLNADKFDNEANTNVTAIDAVPDGWLGLDIAEKTIKKFSEVIENSKTILWNGPMGVFEMEKFSKGTTAIAKAIAAATEKGAFSLIGGGDSVAAINKNKLADKVSYVSTGGGAMLEYMEGKKLPGITAIRGE